MMISHQDQSDLVRLRDEGVRFALALETMFGKRCNLTGDIGEIDAAIYLGMTDAEFKASQVGIVNRRGYDIEYKNVLYQMKAIRSSPTNKNTRKSMTSRLRIDRCVRLPAQRNDQ